MQELSLRTFFESLILMVALIMALSSRVQADIQQLPIVKVSSYLKVDGSGPIKLSQFVTDQHLPVQLIAELESVTLGEPPQLGEQRVYSSQVIAQALRSSAELNKYKFVIPSQIKVENRGFEMNEEVVRQELLQKWKNSCEDCQLSVRRLSIPVLPKNLQNLPWSIEAKSDLPRGSFTLPLVIKNPKDKKESLFWVHGQVEVRKLVPVLNKAINFGQRLTKDDIRWEWRDISTATDGTPDENQIIGQKMRLTARAGDILFFQSLDREKAIHRGEVVRATVGDGRWSITLEALTEQDGYVGDVIQLRNRQTQKILTGEVKGRGEVAIR